MQKISLITIGTEVCTGEIINGNAKWLAAQLCDLNFDVLRHVTVPDERELMIDAMQHCAKDSEILVLTGGLGPTTDDFTRDIVCEWQGKASVFDEASWNAIELRLSKLNVPIAKANRQQCYFPEGAHILKNPAGTANGFIIDTDKGAASLLKAIVVLPGPPAEIAAIWNAGLETYLRSLAPVAAQRRLWTWHCMGLSESRLGEIVEEALQGSGYLTGYRPHIPYVDVKVWAPADRSRESDVYLQNLDQAIRKWTITRDKADIAVEFLRYVSGVARHVKIIDEVTAGMLSQRLGQASRLLPPDVECRMEVITVIGKVMQPVAMPRINEECWTLMLHLTGELGGWRITLTDESGSQLIAEDLKFGRSVTPDTLPRFQAFVCELTFARVLGR